MNQEIRTEINTKEEYVERDGKQYKLVETERNTKKQEEEENSCNFMW